MITRTDLDVAFNKQRQLTTSAIAGPGLESYLTNLGFVYEDLYAWTRDYSTGNIMGTNRDWSDDDITFVASLLTRAMAVGLVLGRESKP